MPAASGKTGLYGEDVFDFASPGEARGRAASRIEP
jgi:hypothetical protein